MDTGGVEYVHSLSSIDAVVPEGAIIVPQRVYTERPPLTGWQQKVVFPPGTNLKHAKDRSYVHHAEYKERVATSNVDRLKFTLRLHWPGYAPWSCNIQARERKEGAEPVQLAVLTERIAHAISRFFEKERTEEHSGWSSEERWDVQGTPPETLTLLELRRVSEGSWQPVLCYSPSAGSTNVAHPFMPTL